MIKEVAGLGLWVLYSVSAVVDFGVLVHNISFGVTVSGDVKHVDNYALELWVYLGTLALLCTRARWQCSPWASPAHSLSRACGLSLCPLGQ